MEPTLIQLTTVNSTNSYSKALLQSNNLMDNTVVVADYQDSGKGQGENIWVSNRGENILFSWIVFSAFLAVSDQFMLSKAVSLGIVDALDEFGLNLHIKWPNDIVCDNKKLGGILIENTIQGKVLRNSVVGVGINVNQHDFPSFPFPPTSISEQCNREIKLLEVMDRVLHYLMTRFDQLKQGDWKPIDQLYLEKLYRRGRSSIFVADKERFEGKIVGVNEFGELEIEVSGKIRIYGFHSVKMII